MNNLPTHLTEYRAPTSSQHAAEGRLPRFIFLVTLKEVGFRFRKFWFFIINLQNSNFQSKTFMRYWVT